MCSFTVFFLFSLLITLQATQEGIEEDWGEGLKVLTTYKPSDCKFSAQNGDIIHYHYVGRLEHNGQVFGRSFDYNSPYIVALGQGRIIAGMDRGLVGTCLYERRRITFPPHLGYGERGVGEIIPPNSTLVFYIRLIKLERNGHVLGRLFDLKDAWDKGLQYYSDGDHNKAVESFEESINMFDKYQAEALYCLKSCQSSNYSFSRYQEALISDEIYLRQFLLFSAKAKCISKCKKERLKDMINPDPSTLELYKKRIPYSYLQYSYYKVGKLEEAAKCAYSFFFYHPNDSMILDALKYYHKHLNLSKDDIISREPGLQSHQQHYLTAKQSYNNGQWLKSAENFELAIALYKESLNDCLLLCEDVVFVNMTTSLLSEDKKEKLEEYGLMPDSMEYYNLLRNIIVPYLKCRIDCHNRMATVNGKYHDKYLSGHFHYLQFDYFKLDLLNKSASAASTFSALEPSDTIMANNIKFYRSNLNVSPEHFEPREDIISIMKHFETEKRLLDFAITGSIQRRQGTRGDNAILHEEL